MCPPPAPSDNSMVKQCVPYVPGHVWGFACMGAFVWAACVWKDIGQQMSCRSLEWNWPKKAMHIPIWAGIVARAEVF